jgi:hypothetical protein
MPMEEWIMVTLSKGRNGLEKKKTCGKSNEQMKHDELGQLIAHYIELLNYNLVENYVKGIHNIYLR